MNARAKRNHACTKKGNETGDISTGGGARARFIVKKTRAQKDHEVRARMLRTQQISI